MQITQSKDGTPIAFEKRGDGPPVIFVDGALCARQSKADLAKLVAEQFTVYSYDRRGRGDSGDTQPYAVDREIEDIAALIADAGGTAGLYGHSSGASLALDAAVQLEDGVSKLAMYEAPYNDAPEARLAWGEYIANLNEALRAGRPGDAVKWFMRYIGTPDEQIDAMSQAPFLPAMEAIAPTLAYDHTAILGPSGAVPADRARQVSVPTLVMHGTQEFPFMAVTAMTLSRLIPGAALRAIEGQGHDVSATVLAPVLREFFAA